tara:strand:+ start:3008 stop:3223 length:216 start_codon:yes stop_codon:yes gene_type:complete
MCNAPHSRVGKVIRQHGRLCRECFATTEAFFTVQQFTNHLFYWSGTETNKMTGNLFKNARKDIEDLKFWGN